MSELKTREQIQPQFKWDLSALISSDEDWNASLKTFESAFELIKQYEGKLNQSPETLLECLKLEESLKISISKLFLYASLQR
ncbi:MAG: oligoendopeptidase F, partial [Defluviitaleaceae bacterium]|nr:oligoendopeptidase F [Defluviitaleaceae bacterium]